MKENIKEMLLLNVCYATQEVSVMHAVMYLTV